MIIIDNVKQGSPEWFALRAGVPSASNFSKIVTGKGDPSKSAKEYMQGLAGEKITGMPDLSGYKSIHMENGNEREEESRLLFSAITGIAIRQVGLVFMDDLRNVSCSPDGLGVDEEIGLELKNPMLKTHVKYLLDGKLPSTYFGQVQGSLMVTGYKHWYFMSHYSGIKPLILKIERDEEYIGKLRAALDKFNAELTLMAKKLA